MITGNHCDTSLVLWDLVSGEMKRFIEVGGGVRCFDFSPNGKYFALIFVNSFSFLCNDNTLFDYSVFDVKSNYTLLQNDILGRLEGERSFVTGYKSDSWLASDGCSDKELYRDGLVFKLRESSEIKYFEDLFFRPSTKTQKIASLIMRNFGYFGDNLFDNFRLHKNLIFLNDNLQIVIFNDHTLEIQDNKLTSGNISFDGQYFYQHYQFLRELRVLKRDANGWNLVNRKIRHNVIALAVVKNGVFVVTLQGIIEIWNFEMSKRLISSQVLNAIECCESVSDYLIACVGKTEVSFIDSRNLQVVSSTSMSENQRVLACSSQYHVLVVNENTHECLIMTEDKRTHSVYNAGTVKIARFSPNGGKLVLCSDDLQKYHCYEISGNSLRPVCELPMGDIKILYFLEDEYFIAISSKKVLFLTCALSGKILTCFELDDYPTSVFYCHETQILIVNYLNGGF